MKVKEIRFDKLFSLGKAEGNERIGFTVEIEQGDNPDKTAGEQYFKILAIEDCLNGYRRILSWIGYTSQEFDDTQNNVRHTKDRMQKMKVQIEELLQKAEKGDVDSRLRHACERDSYKTLKKNLSNYEQQLEKLDNKLKTLVKAKQTLRERIIDGTFSLEGIEIPKAKRSYY